MSCFCRVITFTFTGSRLPTAKTLSDHTVRAFLSPCERDPRQPPRYPQQLSGMLGFLQTEILTFAQILAIIVGDALVFLLADGVTHLAGNRVVSKRCGRSLLWKAKHTKRLPSSRVDPLF